MAANSGHFRNTQVTALTPQKVINIMRQGDFQIHHHLDRLATQLGYPADRLCQHKMRLGGSIEGWTYWDTMEDCIEWWMRNRPDSASWAELARMVKHIDKRLAKAMKELSPKNEAPCVVSRWKRNFFSFWSVLAVLAVFIMSSLVKVTHHLSYNRFISTNTHLPIDSGSGQIMPPLDQRIWVGGDTGPDVVDKCIETLRTTLDDGFDYEYLRRLAFVMSRDGNPLYPLHIDGGIWQVSQYAFRQTKLIQGTKLLSQCEELLDVKWNKISKIKLEKPIFSAVAARLYLSTIVDDVIPPVDDIIGQQEYWWRHYMLNHESKRFTDDQDYKNTMKTYLRTIYKAGGQQ